MCPCEELCIYFEGIYDLDFSGVPDRNNDGIYTLKVRFFSLYDQYVYMKTIAGDMDTSFYNIEYSNLDGDYTYNDDTEGLEDINYDYNASLSLYMLSGEFIEFKINGASATNIYLDAFTL